MAGKYEKSCGVIPFRRSKGAVKFLLVKNIGGHWEFPKGHQEKGESDAQTAMRECEEETGLRVKKIFSAPYYEQYFYVWKGKHKSKKVTYFLGEMGGGKPRIQAEEVTGYIWLDYGKALRKLTFPEIKKILKAAKAELEEYLNENRLNKRKVG